jgi:hypothetical protein
VVPSFSFVCGKSKHTVPLHDLYGGNGMEDLCRQISLSLLVAWVGGVRVERETRDHLLQGSMGQRRWKRVVKLFILLKYTLLYIPISLDTNVQPSFSGLDTKYP